MIWNKVKADYICQMDSISKEISIGMRQLGRGNSIE